MIHSTLCKPEFKYNCQIIISPNQWIKNSRVRYQKKLYSKGLNRPSAGRYFFIVDILWALNRIPSQRIALCALKGAVNTVTIKGSIMCFIPDRAVWWLWPGFVIHGRFFAGIMFENVAKEVYCLFYKRERERIGLSSKI